MENKSPSYSETKQGIFLSDSRLFKHIAPALVVCIGIALSVLIFMTTGKMEDARLKAGFEQDAKNRFTSFKNISDNYLLELEALKAFYAASEKVTRAEFRVFTKELLSHFNRTQALEWIPRVPDPERAAYEAEARREGLPDFQITERSAQGVVVKADRRKEYFPIYFVEPFKGNEAALGNDLASEPLILAALNYARDTEEVIATAGIKPVQEKGESYSVLILQPVYSKGLPADSIKAKRNNLEGFVLGAFRLGDLLEEAMSSFVPAGIDIYLYDISANDKENILYFHASRIRAVQTSPVSNINELTKGLHYSESFEMAGRKWLALFIPTPDYISSKKTWDAWWFLAGGILVTGLLTGYIRLINNQTAQDREYTAGLLRAKEELENEITERKRSEKALYESEKKYRDMFESATDSIFIMDLEGNFIDVNSIAYTRLGYSKNEMLSMHISQLDPPEFAAKVPERMAQLRDHGFAIFDSAHLRKDGTVMPVEINARLYDYDGKKACLSFIRDITERKKAEHNLQKAEQEIRTIYNSIAGHLTVVDRNFRIVNFNSVVEKQFGSAIKGKLCYEVYRGRSHICPDCGAKTTFETGKPAFIFMPATSVSNPFEIYTSPIFDEQGEVVAVVEHGIEVTEKIKALEALKESEERFKALTESTSDWIWAVNENAVYTYASPKIKDLLGYEPEEVIGKTPFDFMPQEEVKRVAEEFGEIVKARRPIERLENVNLHKNGRLVVLETSGVPISDAEGYFRGYRGIDRDITGRKKMEDRIVASLEEKEILLREIHHRVKNNMTVIYSLLDLQSKFTSERHDREMLNDAKARIKAMALIHEKLYRSKDMSKIDFSDYLKDILNNMFMSYLKDPGRIALNIEVRDVDLGIDDAIPCGLIINELVSNALKHAFPEDRTGEITVGMRLYDKDMIELVVADNGIGLPADLDSRKKASMGLSLVDALVNQLNGKIELHKDEGTKFRITFMSHK